MNDIPTRQTYVDQVRRWLPGAYERFDEQIDQWRLALKDGNIFGEAGTPGAPVTLAYVEAFLAVEDDDAEMARKAAQRMLSLRQYADEIPRDLIPDNAAYRNKPLPPQGNFFVLPFYLEAYGLLRDRDCFSSDDHATIQQIVADSVAPTFHFPEWGSHNRAMLRAWTLAAAAAVCPEHSECARWQQMGRQIAADSLTGWTVEDAIGYHAIWSRAVLRYVDITGQQQSFFREPTSRFYFEYYLNLICPIGSLSDFGDSDWLPNPQLFLASFEAAARQYQDPHLRWAAAQMYQRLQQRHDTDTFGDPSTWIHAAGWVDDDLQPAVPDWGSRDVLEELAGKKVVFRSGWEPDSTFLLLNYKPETDYGSTIRNYMRNTISVEAEKAHHGHSDENAICTLVHNGALLLHDGGYRENLPNGKYRADYYHNRPVVRRGLLRESESVYDFLHDDGHHRPMQTERIDMRTFDEVDFSRTRATDLHAGYQHDRVIAYLKQLGWFLVIDAIRFDNVGPHSICNLFYTHDVVARGPGWFDTQLGSMRAYDPPENAGRLLIVQPAQDGMWSGSESVRRYYQDEVMLHQTTSGRTSPGMTQVFYSALIPHDGSQDPAELAACVQIAPVSRPGQAAAMTVQRGDDTITVGAKLDLELGIRFEDVRPRRDWNSSHTEYGDWATDANFLYGRRIGSDVSWAWTEATRLELGGKELFQAPEGTFPFQYIGEPTQHAVTTWRAWEQRGTL